MAIIPDDISKLTTEGIEIGSIVEIHWRDSAFPDWHFSWNDADKLDYLVAIEVKSVGYVARLTNSEIVLVANKTLSCSNVAGAIAIPLQAIITVTTL